MESHGSTGWAGDTSMGMGTIRTFSVTIVLTYVGMGFFGLLALIASFYDLLQAVMRRAPLLLLPCFLLLCLAGGFIYVMLAFRQRRNWARIVAVWFWLLCLIWTGRTIARNGLHPEPPAGPLKYSNAAQLAGARYTAFISPYCMALVELTALYCLLRKASLVNQFVRPGQK